MIRAALLTLLLTGCASFGSGNYGGANGVPVEIVTRPPYFYSRDEVDAINAEVACRAMARSNLQAARCGVRR
jgi:hypothetical protein